MASQQPKSYDLSEDYVNQIMLKTTTEVPEVSEVSEVPKVSKVSAMPDVGTHNNPCDVSVPDVSVQARVSVASQQPNPYDLSEDYVNQIMLKTNTEVPEVPQVSEVPSSSLGLLSQSVTGQFDILNRYDSVNQLRRATQLHCYQQNCGCKLQRGKQHGGKKKVFVCTSDGKCPYVVTWRQRTKLGNKWWEMDNSNSMLIHAIGCESTPHMSQDLIANMPEFKNAIVNDKSSTLKVLERAALTAGVTKSHMTSRMLYRAKNSVVRNTAKNYDENFNHLESWGNKFVSKNRGSHFHIERDEFGRFVLVGTLGTVDIFDTLALVALWHFWHFGTFDTFDTLALVTLLAL